jgi:F420-0:gamma-glutamyl ligase
VVSLCEGSTAPVGQSDKEQLVVSQAQYHLPVDLSGYHYRFTITGDTLIPAAGIDESNADGHYVLWPKDAQATCNAVRAYLCSRFKRQEVGVIITDSTSQPLRRGSVGICLAHSGFLAVNDYIGKPDLFGRPMHITVANISGGLAAAAVLAMGEGVEQTPLAVIAEVPFVQFQDRDPNESELAFLHLKPEDDLFAPFLTAVDWQPGGRSTTE